MRYLLYMKLLDTIKDIICESPKFNGTVTHDHRNRRVDMSSEAMKWKDKSPTYRQSATMEDIELEEVVEDMEVYHPDFLPEDMTIEDLEDGSFNKGKYYTIQSPQKWVQHELGEDLENWSYDGDSIGVNKELDEYVDKNLYKTLKLNKGGEFNEVEDLDEYRFDFYEEDKKIVQRECITVVMIIYVNLILRDLRNKTIYRHDLIEKVDIITQSILVLIRMFLVVPTKVEIMIINLRSIILLPFQPRFFIKLWNC